MEKSNHDESVVDRFQYRDITAWVGGGYVNVEDGVDHVVMTMKEARVFRNWLMMVTAFHPVDNP